MGDIFLTISELYLPWYRIVSSLLQDNQNFKFVLIWNVIWFSCVYSFCFLGMLNECKNAKSAKIDNCLNSTFQKSEIWCCSYNNNLTLGNRKSEHWLNFQPPLSFRRKKMNSGSNSSNLVDLNQTRPLCAI